MYAFSTRKALTTVIGAAGLALGAMMLTLPAEADSTGPRIGAETRPAVYYYVPAATYDTPVVYSYGGPYYYNGAPPAYYPVRPPPVIVAPVIRASESTAQLACSEGKWRRSDGSVVYGVACLQPDGIWRLAP